MTFCFNQFLPRMRERSVTNEVGTGFVSDETCSVVDEVQNGSDSVLETIPRIWDEGFLNGSMYFSISLLGEVARFGASLHRDSLFLEAKPLGVQLLESNDRPEYIVRCIRCHNQNGVRFVWTPFDFSAFDFSDYFSRKMAEAQDQIQSAIESIVDKKKEGTIMRNSFFLSEQMLRTFPFLDTVREQLIGRYCLSSEAIGLGWFDTIEISGADPSVLEETSYEDWHDDYDYRRFHSIVDVDGECRVLPHSREEEDPYPSVGEQLFSSGERPKFIVRYSHDGDCYSTRTDTLSVFCFGGFDFSGYFARKLGEAADLIQSETESLLDEIEG